MNKDNKDRWLSEGAEVLVQEIEDAPADALHCEVLVVGSGYGGAVAAARLAGARPETGSAGVRVYVLERGNEYLPGEFPATFAELPGHVRFSRQDGAPPRGRAWGLFDLRLGSDVNALVGNGLGGGSLINAAVMERPTADAFDRSRWPDGIDRDSLDCHYARAEAMLGIAQIPNEVPKLASLLAAGRRLGAEDSRKAWAAVAFEDDVRSAAGVAMRACLQCGDCVSGCNHRAKQSLDVNYLALARANGARLFCGATVHIIRMRSGGGYAVEFFFTDPAKARSDRDRPYVVHARNVVLAAGTLGSTEILLRSRGEGLPMADAALGEGFSGNGDLIAVAYGQKQKASSSAMEGQPPVERKIGPTITGLVRTKPNELARPLVIEEFAIPGALRRLLAEVVTTTDALYGLAEEDTSRHRPGERFDDPLAVSDGMLEHTPVYGMMGDDGADGRIALCPGATRSDAQVRIRWDGVSKLPVFEAQMRALHAAHDGKGGLGGRVLPNPMWKPLPPFKVLDGLPVRGPVTTVHPLGGCRMADDKVRGVVDPWGCVYGASGDNQTLLPGLAVLDGSIVPVALGINPALTITALAERAVPVLAQRWNLRLRASDALQAEPRPVRRDLTQPRAPRPTTIALQERMTGRIHVGAEPYEMGAMVEFAAIDVHRLRRLPRAIAQPRVVLTFRKAGEPETRATCSGEALVLVREQSTFASRVRRSLDLAQRRLQRFSAPEPGYLPWRQLVALCSHLGQARLIRYAWTVEQADENAPVRVGEHLQLTKRLEFTESANPWRQLSEGRLDRIDECPRELGWLALDPSYFVEKMVPLLQVERQQDQPNQLGDLAELALWVLRVVLRIHLLNFLPPADDFNKSQQRLPGTVAGVEPEVIDVQPALPGHPGLKNLPRRLLSRYRRGDAKARARPVLLIHGFGAGGSTFAHPSIDPNLVGTLLAAGREVWVLDLRTSIGLDQRVYWSFDEVAMGDIPQAVEQVLALSQPPDGKLDVVAHCIGAAMLSVAVLRSPELHRKIGALVLSQVGPLLRASAFNRFRAFIAGYLQQFVGALQFDTRPADSSTLSWLLIDAVLATFPYPDDDGEAQRLKALPGFAAVRHRADAIFGQTMRLKNIGDNTLRALDAIYGWVMVRGLAQVGHYARAQVLTDAAGVNQAVAFDALGERFAFPVLLLHGRQNAVFDWRGAYDTFWLLKQVFPDQSGGFPKEPPQDQSGDLVLGQGTPRQLHVLAEYGHQDMLIGQHAQRDVFARITAFLDEFAQPLPPGIPKAPTLTARLPWMGPWLGRVDRVGTDAPARLRCRLALQPPPAHVSAYAVVHVPARRQDDMWRFDFQGMVVQSTTRDALLEEALVVELRQDWLATYQGFAIVTVHDDLPVVREAAPRIFDAKTVEGLFALPDRAPHADVRKAVEQSLGGADAEALDLTVVRLDPAWIRAALAPAAAPQASLCFAMASCQYPTGLVDRLPAQRTYRRLTERLEASPTAQRPQLLLLTGDQVYVDQAAGLFDPSGADEIGQAYKLNFRLDALRRITASLPTYPLLDDHEVQDNWEPSASSSDTETNGLRAYVSNQHKLVSDKPRPPFDYTMAAAGFPFYMLDTRSTRQRRALRAAPHATHLSEASIHATHDLSGLRTWLERAPADAPKFIVSPVALFPFPRAAVFGHNAVRLGLDDWSGYPRSQFELLDLLRNGPARQVVVLSGDRHMSSVSSLWLEGGQGWVEVISIVSSALYAPWPFANSRADEYWLEGPLALKQPGCEIRATMVTAALGTSDGYAVVHVARIDDGAWTLDVTLDLDEGAWNCRRNMGVPGNTHWVIAGPQGRRIRQPDAASMAPVSCAAPATK